MPIAVEACRWANEGELHDGELYPGDAQWSGFFDRMFPHTSEKLNGAWLLH